MNHSINGKYFLSQLRTMKLVVFQVVLIMKTCLENVQNSSKIKKTCNNI